MRNILHPGARADRALLRAGCAAAALMALAGPGQTLAQSAPGAIVVINPAGDAVVSEPDRAIDATGDQQVGVLASAGRGSTLVDVGSVTTRGAEAHGIVAFSDTGDTTVRAGSISTSGTGAWGISAVSNQGDVVVDVRDVLAFGDGAIGVRAIAYEGDVSITADRIFASVGDGAAPAKGVEVVNIAQDGVTTLKLGEVMAIGTGIDVQAVNAIDIDAGFVATAGAGAIGISTFTETGPISIKVGEVATEDALSLGVLALSYQGDINIDAGQVRTSGEGADGVYAEALEGDLKIRIGDALTNGVSAYGLFARTGTGAADVSLGRIRTSREFAMGASIAAGGGVSLEADTIQTSGYAATALGVLGGDELLGLKGDVAVRVNRLETRGDDAVGAAVTAYGDVDVAIGSISTLGDRATGLTAFAKDGDLRIVVDDVRTAGEASKAVDAYVFGGDVAVVVGKAETTGYNSGAVFVATQGGDAAVHIGDLSTTGYNSAGATVTVRGGDAALVAEGRVTTTGDFATGLVGIGSGRVAIGAADVRTSGNRATGIEAISGLWFAGPQFDRSIDITAAAVSTRGDNSHGIHASNTDDIFVFEDGGRPLASPVVQQPEAAPDLDIRIRAGAVTTEGEGAVGILVESQGDVAIEADQVVARQARAIQVLARGDVDLKLGGQISGAAAAVELTGENIDLSIGKASVVSGATDALVLSAVGPYTPPAAPTGLALPALAGVVTLDNAGTIRGGTGAAIRITAGSAVINNAGRIEGALALSDGDDVVTNTGTVVVDADNEFGAGNDLFTNKGTVSFGKAAAAQRLSFLGLERFANDGGLIDLRNARAGDTLTLSGTYVGSGDARLALDIEGGAFDSLVVGGAATGRTAITLQSLKPENAVLLDEAVKLVTVGAGSRADAFTLADADQGLVRYGLRYDEKTRVFLLDASAGLAVHQSIRAIEGLRASWRASADAFDAEQAMARAAGGEGGRIWAIAHGSSVSRDADDAAFALAYDQDLVGGQMGASLGARPLVGGQAVFGLTGGYAESTLSFEDQGQEIDMRTFNLGAYGAWRSGNAFATALAKVDSHALKIDAAAAGYEADLDGTSWGVRLEAGYRFDLGGVAFEPVVGLDYLSTTLDDLEVLGQSVRFDDQQGFSGRIGGQAVTRQEMAEGRALLWSAGLEFVHDFDADQRGVLHSGGQTDAAVLTGPESYGRALVGVQFDVGGGLQTYVQGEGRFGDGQSGGGLRIGARYRF